MPNQLLKRGERIWNFVVLLCVAALAASALIPVILALWRVVGGLFPIAVKAAETAATGATPATPPGINESAVEIALRIGWSIVAAGFVVACMVVLLRFKVRQEDERAPPLAPALAIVALGAALVAVVSLAG